MIQKISRGGKMAGLMSYLAGPGKANEHTDQHVIAGHDAVMIEIAEGGHLDHDGALDVANILDRPRRASGTQVRAGVYEYDEEQGKRVRTGWKDAHVWHCSLSLSAEEGSLADEQWAAIAHDFIEGMGFVDPDGAKSSRWVAVRHGVSAKGNDHIHLAVNLVTDDGSRANVHKDFHRAQKVVAELERKHGLAVVEGREAGAKSLSADHVSEVARAREDGVLPVRQELRRRLRSAAAASASEAEFVQRCRDYRLLVRPRFEQGSTTSVVGFSVAVMPPAAVGGKTQDAVWHAPSKLDRQLGLGQLRRSFTEGTPEDAVAAWKKAAGQGTDHGDRREVKRAGVNPALAARMRSYAEHGHMNPDIAREVSWVLANLSITHEGAQGGKLATAAEGMARGHQDRPTGPVIPPAPVRSPEDAAKPARPKPKGVEIAGSYQVRQLGRAGSRDGVIGWDALMRQATRLARIMSETTMMRRPILAGRVGNDLAQALPERSPFRAGAPTSAPPLPPGIAAARQSTIQSGRDTDNGMNR